MRAHVSVCVRVKEGFTWQEHTHSSALHNLEANAARPDGKSLDYHQQLTVDKSPLLGVQSVKEV